MTQNVSTAVMQRRLDKSGKGLDYFPTPPWATRALLEHAVIGHGWRREQIADMSCWEPACGEGWMVRPLREYFRSVQASDVADYGGDQQGVADFLSPSTRPPLEIVLPREVDWIVTNPPFRLAAEFALRGLAFARQGVALLVRTAFLEGRGRLTDLFGPHPPFQVAQFAERVPMVEGRLDEKAASATAYCWIVWPGRDFKLCSPDTRLLWIPPCRTALERPGDYLPPGNTAVPENTPPEQLTWV